MSLTPCEAGQELQRICSMAPVVPVLVIDDAKIARPLAEALVAGGLFALEVTFRTPAALDAIRAMCDVPGSIVGAGTLTSPDDVRRAQQAGARFGVSPGATDALLDACEADGLPFLPGVSTASETMRLVERGYDMLKFFPAEASGGVSFLKSIGGPLPGVTFCPTGGISPTNAQDYLVLDNVVCVGGSWLAPRDLVASEKWDDVAELASLASKLNS